MVSMYQLSMKNAKTTLTQSAWPEVISKKYWEAIHQ